MNIAELCNGSTTDSDSVCEGSNPSSAANNQQSVTADFFISCENRFSVFVDTDVTLKASP